MTGFVKNVRWIPVTRAIADGVTTDDRKLREQLAIFMPDPMISLVESIAREELSGRDGRKRGK